MLWVGLWVEDLLKTDRTVPCLILQQFQVWHFARRRRPSLLLRSTMNAFMPYPNPFGTNFLEAFQSCWLMKLGARRRINASCLA